MTVSGRTLDVWLAARDAGAVTLPELAERILARDPGFDGGARQIAPCVFVLLARGWLVELVTGRYVNARHAAGMRAAVAR